MGMRAWRAVPVWLAIFLVGCGSRVDEPQLGVYRAALQLPGGEAPFGLEITREQDRHVLYLLNGSERTPVTNVQIIDGELQAVFPGYENSLRARLYRDSLKGTVTLIKAGGKEQVIALRATLGQRHRFYEQAPTESADVAGRWETTLTSAEGTTTPAIMLLEQQHDRVTGTVMTPTGDHRFLEGQVHGEHVRLSTFAGGLAYLYHLKVTPSGELEGEYWQGLASNEQVRARRNDAATLAGKGPATTLKDATARFDFTFADLDGRPVSLSDERFRGKVVLVTLGGSWCPNCHDEARFLVPIYREYRDRGFEIIALMFERHGDFDKAAKAVRSYRDDLDIEFTTLVAGVSEIDEASRALPTLSGVYGYPTSIFVDRKGLVRDIHVGFDGPATGSHHEQYASEFRARVEALLAETT